MRIETRARARALQALYACEMRGGKNLDRVATQVWDDLAVAPEERRLAGLLVREVVSGGAALDSRLADLTTIGAWSGSAPSNGPSCASAPLS